MIQRLRDWLRERAHQHAVAAAQGEGVTYVAPALPPYVQIIGEGEGLVTFHFEVPAEHEVLSRRHEQVVVLEVPAAPEQQPVGLAVVPPPLAAEGHAVATRMEQVMTNLRVLTQLQFVDTLTVQAIDDEIIAIDGGIIPGNAAHIASLRVIHTMLSDALNYAGNMHRLVNIYNAAPSMHAAADYLLTLRPDAPQMPDSTAPPFLPLAGGVMFGPLVLNADPRAPSEAATRGYVDTLLADVGAIVGDKVMRAGDTMLGPLLMHNVLPTDLLEAVPKTYVDTLLSGAAYQGTWQVAANIPDLNPPATPPLHGFRWLCVTANPAVPENAPVGMPGIGGQPISNGAFIIWDGPLAEWHYVGSGGMTLIEADSRYLQLAGGTLTGPLRIDADVHIQHLRDGYGLLLFGNAMLYKRVGAGVVLRQSSGNQQPEIENNDGSNRRAILDVNTGVRKAGDTMAGQLTMNGAFVMASGWHVYLDGPNANGNTARIYFRNGGTSGEIYAERIGYNAGQNESRLRFHTANGGWGYHEIFRTNICSQGNGGHNCLEVMGGCGAVAFNVTSSRQLKNSIRTPAAAEITGAWATLKPRRFKWNDPPPPVDEDGKPLANPRPPPPSSLEWGFVADEIGAGAADAVHRVDGEPAGYSVDQLLAITIARVKQLEAEIATLKH